MQFKHHKAKNKKSILKHITLNILLMLSISFVISCGDHSGETTSSSGLTTVVGSGTTIVGSVGALGTLADLGDLNGGVDPSIPFLDTLGAAINDNELLVGQANLSITGPVKEAYSFDIGTGITTPLGLHAGFYGLPADNKPFIYSEAVDVNNNGWIVCNSTTGIGWPDETEKRAFFWDGANAWDLPPQTVTATDKFYSDAVAINDNNIIIFTADNDDGRNSYYFDPGTGYGILGRIIGADSEAVDINNNNQAIINSSSTALWHDIDSDALMVLNYLPNAGTTTAADINNADPGNVVGKSGDRGFFWQAGVMYPIGHLGGGTSEAVSINDTNQVAGNSTTASGATHAFFWQIIGGVGYMSDLGTLGGTNSYAVAINNAGIVIGYSDTGQYYDQAGITKPIQRGFLWVNNVMYNLGTIADWYPYITPDTHPTSKAIAISNNVNNRVVGNSWTINLTPRTWSIVPVIP